MAHKLIDRPFWLDLLARVGKLKDEGATDVEISFQVEAEFGLSRQSFRMAVRRGDVPALPSTHKERVAARVRGEKRIRESLASNAAARPVTSQTSDALLANESIRGHTVDATDQPAFKIFPISRQSAFQLITANSRSKTTKGRASIVKHWGKTKPSSEQLKLISANQTGAEIIRGSAGSGKRLPRCYGSNRLLV